jgi:hypothetical protein
MPNRRTRGRMNVSTSAGKAALLIPAFAMAYLAWQNGAAAGSRDTSPIRIWDLMPSEERDFIALVQKAAAADREGQGEAKEYLSKQMCDLPAATQPADGWVGRVDRITKDEKGHVFVSLRIAEDIYVGAWGAAAASSTPAPAALEGELADKAAQLRGGEWLRFFGRFVRGESDCLLKASDAPVEGVTRPRFVFQFTQMFGL